MIIDSCEHVFTGEVLVDDWDKEYVEYSGLDIDGADFNETWTDGEVLYLLCNGVEYKSVVTYGKGAYKVMFDSAEISHIILPNSNNPNLFTVYPANSNDLTKLEVLVTFSLYRKLTEVKQLDAKFIPANCDMIIEVPRHSAMDLNIGVENVVVNDINNVIELMKQGKLVNVVIKVVHAYSDTVYTHQISPTQILYKENGAFEELSGLHIYWICNANNESIDSPVLYKLVWNGKNVASVEKTPISTMSGAS